MSTFCEIRTSIGSSKLSDSGAAKHKLSMASDAKDARGLFGKKEYEGEHGINLELNFVDSVFMMS